MKKIIQRMSIMLLFIWFLSGNVSAARVLIPGGQVVGLELKDPSVTVAAFDAELGAAARSAGLKQGDRILSIEKKKVTCVEDVRDALRHSDGHVELTVVRDEKSRTLRLHPAATADGPKLGVYLKQGTTGIGTVTYYDPGSGCFGTLGHGVNGQKDTLLQFETGYAYSAQVLSVKKGKIGDPGQLLGALSAPTPLGSLVKNTPQGVFGTGAAVPASDALPAATPEETKTGKATIRATVDDTLREYSVEILKIYPNADDRCRNMLLKVTDPALLERTGGIVQGMSGSPLVQDGKLIGAVTHVLVNDPTMGYGIFIENMLEAAG